MAFFETFGKYKLTERLAFGGMAEVFLATVHGAAGFVKPVVIKRLHPRLSEDGDFVQMLIDEARITAQLTHGNVCQVLDLGQVDGSYYITMEYISGEDVRALQDACIRRRLQLPLGAALYIVAEVLAGLDYAHRKEGPDGSPLGIIHRDISPQNILLSYEGEVKIIDFGIAKARLRLVQTQAGVIKGKFRYMAPEQASGEAMDHRADIFAAGVVLYELLAGSPHAQDLSDTEVLRKMRRADFEPLQLVRPDLPPGLDAMVKRSLQRKARDRYGTAAEFRAELLGFMQDRKLNFGRTELATLMRQHFDEERRRRRSGSCPGVMVIASSDGDSVPAGRPQPSVPGRRSDTEILGGDPMVSAPGAERSASLGRQKKGWVAYAPTSASSPGSPVRKDASVEEELSLRDVELVEGAPPLRLPDSERTLTYEPPLGDLEPEDSSLPTASAVSARAALPTTELQGPSPDEIHRQPTERHEQLHRQPTMRRERSDPGRSRSRASRPRAEPPRTQQELESRTEVTPPPAFENAGVQTQIPSTHPTVSTGFFAKRAETGETRPAPPPAGGTRRTLIGLGVVLALGAGLALTLFLMEGPVQVADRADGRQARARRDAQTSDGSTVAQALLKVRSKPSGAEILLCEKPTGLRTPALVPATPGRRCTLELALTGYEPYRVEVMPVPGSRLIAATLRKSRGGGQGTPVPRGNTGLLRVTSIQVGTVYLDDRAVGRTPQLELRLAPGTYSVRMHFPTLDVRTRVRSVKVQAGRTSVAHFDPQP